MQIELANGMLAIIDDDDAPIVFGLPWKAVKSGKTFYAHATVYIKGSSPPRYTTVQMHRLILGVSPDALVDHRDFNGLNNRRINLRVCSRLQQNRHRRLRRDSSSGYKGVHRHWNKWRATIRVNGKQKHLGLFDTPEQAASAYDQAAIRHFGTEWCVLNFPQREAS